MDELLSKENLECRERARAFARKYIAPVAAELDRKAEFPWSVIEAARREKMAGVWVGKEYVGQDSGVLNLAIVVEEFSRACGGVGVGYAVTALGSFPIILSGTEEQKKKWLPHVASGERLVAFGLSEKEAGSDAGSLQTAARRDGDFYVLQRRDEVEHERRGLTLLHTLPRIIHIRNESV